MAPPSPRGNTVCCVEIVGFAPGAEGRGTDGIATGHIYRNAAAEIYRQGAGAAKIGQVLARNRDLHPRLRRALTELENGISDVTIEEIAPSLIGNFQSQIESYAIRIEAAIHSEASVSAVVGFTWRNPASGRRERGVFKVLKPHIASCYAEDMTIIGELAQHLARKHRASGVQLGQLAETLTEIRLLLQREVDFPREQATLANALGEYRSLHGVRVPRLIPLLSTATITALTFERGRKVTEVRALPAKLSTERGREIGGGGARGSSTFRLRRIRSFMPTRTPGTCYTTGDATNL